MSLESRRRAQLEGQQLLHKLAEQVLALEMVVEANGEATAVALSALAQALGAEELDVATMRAAFYQEKRRHLQQSLLQIEDVNSSAAAYIQAIIDRVDLHGEDVADETPE